MVIVTNSFPSQKQMLSPQRTLVLVNSNDYTFSRCKVVAMCSADKRNNDEEEPERKTHGHKRAQYLSYSQPKPKWRADNGPSANKMPIRWKKPQLQWRPDENPRITNRNVCWNPIEISNQCRMSSCNAQLRPIILQGPKLSSNPQESQEQIELDPHARLLRFEFKRLSFQNVIMKRPFEIQIWHIQLHVTFTLWLHPLTVKHSSISSTNFLRAKLLSEPLFHPKIVLLLEMTLQLIKSPCPRRNVSPAQHTVKTVFVFQRIFKNIGEHFGEKGEL